MAGESKTEKATPKKRRDERKEGNIFLSSEIVSVMGVLGTFYSLKLLFPFIYKTVKDFMEHYLSLAADDRVSFVNIFKEFTEAVIKGAFPIMLIGILLTVVATGAQTRFLFTMKKVRPKLSNINPLQGIKKIFYLKNLVELLKSLIKVVILAVILYMALKEDFSAVVRTMDMDLKVSTVFMFNRVMDMVMKVVLVFAVIAMFDFLYQWWDYERQIKMSKQEVKEELKQTEGNPEIKGKIRQMQKQRARTRMMQAVPDADVIIRNPTHYAVALKYDVQRNSAPVVIAKGQDELALRIVSIGEENGVVIIEDKPLARGLYAAVELGTEIPKEYYGVVAEILIYVYRLKNKVE